jgi:hypothetical protein
MMKIHSSVLNAELRYVLKESGGDEHARAKNEKLNVSDCPVVERFSAY